MLRWSTHVGGYLRHAERLNVYILFYERLLHDFDLSLSAYIPNSVLTAINNNDTSVLTTALFDEVFHEAKRINQLSQGLFDITVGPLANAYGFGPGQKQE
ncbi:MAG: hypothetical protein HC896_16240 [Bacteroidales bacterium]|nr:hypothetical protein [Bacteroidales bacterium]